MAHSRREFIRQAGCGVLSTAALIAGIKRFGLVNAHAQSATDYKALVCIFLFGGNDGNNTIVPIDDYGLYAAVRNNATNIQLPEGSLLPITPPSDGRQFGLHPNLTELHGLWSEQKVAILCNAGTLVQPINREEYRTYPSLRPSQLYSHTDQQNQWQTSVVRGQSQTGWAGRVADTTRDLTGATSFPTITSVSGVTIFSVGRNTSPLVLSPHPTPLNQALRLQGFDSSLAATARLDAMQQLREVDRDATLVDKTVAVTSQALQTSVLLSENPTFAGFPNTSISNQLYQVAKIISLRQQLGISRQIFFCSLGGFDTHNGQLAQQINLFTQLSRAMKAFYDVTVQLGVSPQVTTFTLSDFGRTFHPSTGAGSDHAWGSHQFIMGDAVRGGDFYGTPNQATGSIFPTLVRNGPDDADFGSGARGRWVPTTSVDQYVATLARWYGVTEGDLPQVFPGIMRFPTSDLGFINS